MIKFFRKIRQQLLSENKVGKYLLYAFGEIILVIVGILIALNLNQKSQQKETEARIDALFEVILEDLSADIIESHTLFEMIRRKDSLGYIVLNNKLKVENYHYNLIRLTTTFPLFNKTMQGYENLTQNMSVVPAKYNSALKDLGLLYNSRREGAEYWNGEIGRLAKRNEDYFVDNLEWYSNPKTEIENINSLLNSFQYKNSVRQFMKTNRGLLRSITRYRTYALNAYQKIARILDKPITHESLKINEKAANLYVGEWKHISDLKAPNLIFTLKDDRLFTDDDQSDIDGDYEQVIISSQTTNSKTKVIVISNRVFYTDIFEGDTLTSTYNSGVFKFVKVKKEK